MYMDVLPVDAEFEVRGLWIVKLFFKRLGHSQEIIMLLRTNTAQLWNNRLESVLMHISMNALIFKQQSRQSEANIRTMMDDDTNSPMASSRHMTEGVAKQAKTSSVLVKCVRCGSTMGCPRHCPHMYT